MLPFPPLIANTYSLEHCGILDISCYEDENKNCNKNELILTCSHGCPIMSLHSIFRLSINTGCLALSWTRREAFSVFRITKSPSFIRDDSSIAAVSCIAIFNYFLFTWIIIEYFHRFCSLTDECVHLCYRMNSLNSI